VQALGALNNFVRLFPENQKKGQRKPVHKKEEFSFSLRTQESEADDLEKPVPLFELMNENSELIFNS
jgi:hypothetical protein